MRSAHSSGKKLVGGSLSLVIASIQILVSNGFSWSDAPVKNLCIKS